MPRQIDADARRAQIALLAARLIADEGIEKLSFRSLAIAAGASTTVITHYFTDKQELLAGAYRAAVDEARGRVEALPAHTDRRFLQLACEAVLPLDTARRRNWRTWLAFFGVAVFDEKLAEMQRRRVTSHRALLEAGIRAAQGAGLIDAVHPPARAARTLLALVQGIATEAAFDPADWPPVRQKSLVRMHIDSLAPGSGQGPHRAVV